MKNTYVTKSVYIDTDWHDAHTESFTLLQEKDINYIFLSKCGWDYDYPIDKLGEEYTYEDVLLKLVEEYRSEAKFYEEKANKILEEKRVFKKIGWNSIFN